MRKFNFITDYLIELNIFLIIFIFPFIHKWSSIWFNNLWISLLVLWTLKKIVSKENIVIPPASITLAIFMGTIFLSSFFSEQLPLSFIKISYTLMGIGLYFVIYDFYKHHEKRFERTVHYFLVSTVLVSIDAIIQFIFSKDIFGIPMDDSRVRAFFIHPFFVALWAGIGLFLSICRLTETPDRIHQIAYRIFLVILGSAFLFSKTRAAWIAMGVILCIIFFSMPRKRTFLKYLIVGGSFVLLLFLINTSLRMRAFSIVTDTNLRWSIWIQSSYMIMEKFTFKHWLIGRGPGLFKLEYPHYDLIKGGETFPHMIAIELLYALGIIGIIAFLIWVSRYIFIVVSAHKKSAKDIYCGYIGFMPLLILFMCFINESFFSRYFSFLFWFASGFSLATLPDIKNNSKGQQSVI